MIEPISIISDLKPDDRILKATWVWIQLERYFTS